MAIPLVKPITKKPPLAPLESIEEEEEELVSKRAKKNKQMAQSAKVQALTNYWYLHHNIEYIGLI